MNTDTGTILGMMNSNTSNTAGKKLEALGPYDMTGNGISAAGSRLSFVFAMRGPCVAIDTACSSSLVATHIGFQLIRLQ